MSRIQSAIDQICRARKYTEDLLNHIEPADWFRQPHEGVTHIGWQVGHLAVAEYGLGLRRVRGAQPEDGQMISESFQAHFGKGSIPSPDASQYPPPETIRRVFENVHRRVIEELNGFADAVADQPVAPPPHPMFKTKLDALHFCAQHEFIHAGQIALLRRLLGQPPLR